MATTTEISHRQFSLTSPFLLAGKFGASCALALISAKTFGIPDLVTAAFVAVLCCSPGALMGLRTSMEQLAGSVVGGGLGTLAVILQLPQIVGVPLAVTLAVLSTHLIGFYRGAIAASFTALFVQIVTFGDPLQTYGYRLEAVGVAAVSAFVVNVAVSAFFYKSLFRRRLVKVTERVDELVVLAASQGPAVMFPIFAAMNQVDEELRQALRELSWRRNKSTAAILEKLQVELLWLRDYVHLIVNLEMGESESSAEILTFISWLAKREGDAPSLSGERATTRTRLLQMIQAPANAEVAESASS